jgi:hypothetical protein
MVLIVPDTYLVSINATSGGQNITNVVGVRKSFSGADLVAAAVETAWTQTGGPIKLMNNGYAMKDFSAMFLGQADGEVVTKTSNAVGPLTATKSTNAACALVSYGGGSRARTSKGRLYFGPIGESDINPDGRTLAAGSVTAITAAFNVFKLSLINAGFEWVVVSRKLQSASTINAISVQSIIATQRRRIR